MAGDTLVGAGSPSANYLGHRLVYEQGEVQLDPLTSPRYLLALALRWFFFTLIWLAGELVLLAVTTVLGIITGGGQGSAVLVGLGFLLNIIWSLGLIVAYWLLPVPALISEWKLTLDGRSEAQDDALDHVAFALEARAAPISEVVALQLSVSGQPDRTYLRVRDGFYSAYASCFAFGTDLYIGWTFWLYLSPLRWFLLWWTRSLRSLRPTSPIVDVNKSLDTARAMRELVHRAVHEGVDVAVTGRVASEEHGAVGELLAQAAPK